MDAKLNPTARIPEAEPMDEWWNGDVTPRVDRGKKKGPRACPWGSRFLIFSCIIAFSPACAYADNKTSPSSRDNPIIHYNDGVASYRNADFKRAKELFTKSLITENKSLENKAEYNIGNSLFKIAKSQEESDPDAAIATLKQAIHYYHRAIENNPKDLDAKYNHELAQKVLKILLEKPKPPQKQKQDNNQDKQNKEQQQQQQEQQNKEQNTPKEQPQPKDDQKPNDQEQKKESGQEKEEKLSEEEAKMLASQYGQEGPRMKLDQEKNRGEKQILKDW